MKLVEDPAEQTTAVTDIILALVAFGGVLLLQWSPVNTGELWRINIWSMALGLVGLAAALGTWLWRLRFPFLSSESQMTCGATRLQEELCRLCSLPVWGFI
jgi:hypothetical protein